MKKLKNVVPRFFILLSCIALAISYSSCAPDQKDKDLLEIQTFLEQHDRSTWTAIEEDMRIYIKLNDDDEKDLEVWISELNLAKLMTKKECFYHSREILNSADVLILEHSGSTLSFTHLDDETYTFSMDGERLKLEFETLNNVKDTIYFSRANEDLYDLDLCFEERNQEAFDWKFSK